MQATVRIETRAQLTSQFAWFDVECRSTNEALTVSGEVDGHYRSVRLNLANLVPRHSSRSWPWAGGVQEAIVVEY
jgi:hypothetical protein